jgi:NAD(P)-dependent dehydrogenase (short-subunit alcohol dehydrogenase family)
VIAIDVQDAKLQDLQKQLGDDRVTTIQFDLRARDKESYDALEHKIQQASGGVVDTYLINAGIIKLYDGEMAKTIGTTPIDEADTMYAINVRSHLALYQRLLPMLKQSDAGRIILTSSPIVGRKDPASANYAWTKKALEDNVAMMQQELAASADGKNITVVGYVPPPVQAWLRAHWKNEPLYANPMPEDVVELPLRLASPALAPQHNGTMFTYVDKRKKNIQAKVGENYDANFRTENGFDLGIRTRKIGEGGGIEGAEYVGVCDTWTSRQLMGEGKLPPLDENVRLRDALKPPQFVADAMKQGPKAP